MEKENRVQVILRLRPDLYDKVKYAAKKKGVSVNKYIVSLLEKDCLPDYPVISKDLKVSDEILALVPKHSTFRKFTKEELDNDPKLAYLVEKYGL